MKRSRWSLCLVLLGACEAGEPPLAPAPDEVPEFSQVERAMIVVLAEREDPHRVARDHGVTARHVYRRALNGFAGEMADLARSGLLRDHRVVRVRPDQTLTVEETQFGAPWSLDRIDQRTASLDGTYTYEAAGAGVSAYILDTGIDYPHAEFGGRARVGFDAFGGSGSDCHGHGTHVAGTVGGTTWGVAKNVDLVAVRVLDCNGSGSTSSVLAGIEWILANGTLPAVVNLSFGGERDDLVDDAVRRLHQAGFVAAIAAGNSGADACGFSPARVAEGMTIGATAADDERAYYSNFGNCLDWFAPGHSITSAAAGTANGSRVMSGTSMAAPHVAGAAALYLGQHPDATAQQTIDALAGTLSLGVVANARTTRNHLLYVGTGAAAPGNAEPVARFSATCTRLACTFLDASTDADGTIASRVWSFGDGTTDMSGADQPVHTYALGGVYRATLVVTDDDGSASTWATDVTAGVVLSTFVYRQRSKLSVSLAWLGAETALVDIYVNGKLFDTAANTGDYRMSLRARGTYSIQICETGAMTMCSTAQSVS